jgi:hypothetical protein
MNIRKAATAALLTLVPILALVGCGGGAAVVRNTPTAHLSSTAAAPSSHAQARGGCNEINITLDNVFNGNYADLPPAHSISDLVNELVGSPSNWYDQDTRVPGIPDSLVGYEADIKSAGSFLGNLPGNDAQLWTTPTSSGGESGVQMLINGLNGVKSLCGTATTPWTQNLSQVESILDVPPGSGSLVPSQAPATQAPASSGATCAQADGIVKILANAQSTWNTSAQGVSDDMKYNIALAMGMAIIKAGGPIGAHWSPSGSGTLNADLYQFNSDARQYTAGDLSMLSTVGTDVDALAAYCNITPNSGPGNG